MGKWELAYQDYLNKMKYKDIAEKYDVSINTVKSWKSRKWNAPPEKKVAHKTKKVAHKKEVPLEIVNDGTEGVTDILEHYGITEQQRRFADNYIESANIYQSALQADYSENYAKAQSHRLLDNVGIKSYINDRMRVLSFGRVATQEDILQGLTRIFNREENEHTVVTLRSKKEQWAPTGEGGTLKKMVVETEEPKVVAFPGKISDAVKAADLLLKRLDLSKKQGTDTNITIVDAWSVLDGE